MPDESRVKGSIPSPDRHFFSALAHAIALLRLALLALGLSICLICALAPVGRGLAWAQAGSVGYIYDSLGRLIAVYDPFGNAAVYNYDAVGNLLSITSDLSTQFGGVGLSSNSGLAGSTLTIYGTDFCSNPTVTINGTNATVVSSTSTQIVVTVPSGATSGSVVVSCGSNHVTVGTFTVGSTAPSITGFTPTIGSAGTAVTINGGNFQTNPGLDAVQFNLPRVYASTATGSAITATVPSKATTGHIAVSTPTGQALSSGYFFVPPPPATVSSIAITGQTVIGGSPTNVTLSTAGTKALYAFDASAGTQIALYLTNITMTCCYPTATVFNPDGSTLGSIVFNAGSPTTILPDLTLATTGTYSLLIDSSNVTGSLTFQLLDTPDQTGTISIGGPAVNTSVTGLGQDVSLSFSGTAGQQVSLNITNSTYPNAGAMVYLIPPGGNTTNPLASQQIETYPCACGILADVTLPTTGTYTVFVDPIGTNTGSITLQLFSTADQTGTISIGGPAVNTSATVPGQDVSLPFSGTAGQQISLNISNSNYPGAGTWVYLIPPGGAPANALASVQIETYPCGCGTLADVTLPTTGTYTVFVDPIGANTGTITLQLFSTSDQTGTISIGGPAVNTSATVPGQDVSLPFSGTAGQQVSLNISNSNYPGAGTWVYLIPPGGAPANALASVQIETYPCGCGTLSDVILPTTGTYTVFVDPIGANTGTITLQLWNLSDSSSGVNVSDTYATTTLGDSPQMYWRLDESGPATAINAEPAVSYRIAGPTSPDTAINLNGYAAYVGTTKQVNNPATYSIEIWFKTTTTSGGKLIGFGVSSTGTSNSFDRHIYMTNSGQLIFGQYTGSVVTVTSTASYNDGFWHYAVGTYNGSTMVLYVDGSQMGSVAAGSPQNYNGYWRIGYDNLSNWPSVPSSYYFQGSIGETAVYSSALSATQVSNHFVAAGGGSYDSTVLADSPTSYWKLNETTGPTFADATNGGNSATAIAGSDNGLYQGGVTYGQSGAISTDSAIALDGSTGYATTIYSFTNPQQYSLEVWFKTATSSGGRLIGFGSSQAGASSSYDRHIYITNSGQVVFGQYSGSDVAVTSSTFYNDGAWHHAVGTYNGTTMVLYVDGIQVGSTLSGAPQSYTGYWRLGYDNLAGWPSAPSSYYFSGSIDEAAVYKYALSSTQVSNHYHASGR